MQDDAGQGNAGHSTAGLHSLGGVQAPAPPSDGFRMLLSLPEHAARSLWPLIEKVLQDPDTDVAQLVQYFAQQHNIESRRVLGALQACELLLRQAAALDVSADEFQEDLETLGPGSAAPAQLLMPTYSAAINWLQAKILEDTLADHGKVVTGIDWRVEELKASNHGAGLDEAVLHLALRYREGNETSVIRLQFTPAVARALRQLIGQLVKAGANQPPADSAK